MWPYEISRISERTSGVVQVPIQMGTYIGKNSVEFPNSPVNPFKYFDKGSLLPSDATAVADFPGNLHVAGRPASVCMVVHPHRVFDWISE